MATLPSTLRTSADRDRRDRHAMVPVIYQLFDADHPTAPSSRHQLDTVDEVDLARGAADGVARAVEHGRSRLVLRMADPHVSRPHARLRRDGERWIIQDSRSTNGIRINGALQHEAPLADGDIIELGHRFLLYRSYREFAGADLDGALPFRTGRLSTWVPALAERFAQLASIAGSRIATLVLGPTGTGKEWVARELHRLSGRSGPFVPINCGAIPRDLIASLLFGHRRGAFSGASIEQRGLVVTSSGGTLFLDEIAELPLELQPALLRIVAEGEALAIGATAPTLVDLRVVAATHQNLEHMCADHRFREDLLARLAGFVLQLPPLAERREDLGLMVAALVHRLAGERAPRVRFTVDAARALLLHPWNRNIRQLELRLASALQIAGDAAIAVDHLALDSPDATSPLRARWSGPDLERREALLRVLARNHGNITSAARELGKARSQIQRWMKKYAIDPREQPHDDRPRKA